MGQEPLELPALVELRDGTPILLRLGTPEDRDSLIAGFERLSDESRVSRFFSAMPKLSDLFLDRLLDLSGSHHVAIAALDASRSSDVGATDEGLGVGVARYIVSDDDPTRAEMAVAVIDEYHGKGIGRLLLDALTDHAAGNKIKTFTAMVLATNTNMLRLLMSMGAVPDWDPEDYSIVELEAAVSIDHPGRSQLRALLGGFASHDGTQTGP